MTHYSLGWLPRWLRLVSRTRSAAVLNRAARIRPLAALAKRLGGVAPERDIPPLAGESFQAWFGRRGARGPADGPRLLVWPDTFTNYLEPAIGRDAVAALEALGYRVEVPSAAVCCGLTWHSTGQLGQAKKVLAATLAVLKPWLDDEVPIVGLEPSCLAALKTDSVELLPDDPAAKQASVVGPLPSRSPPSPPGRTPSPRRGVPRGRRPHRAIGLHGYSHPSYFSHPQHPALPRSHSRPSRPSDPGPRGTGHPSSPSRLRGPGGLTGAGACAGALSPARRPRL